jgi:hypothetical protein
MTTDVAGFVACDRTAVRDAIAGVQPGFGR